MITVIQLHRDGRRSVWCRVFRTQWVMPLKGLPFDENAWWGDMLHGFSKRMGRPVLWARPSRRVPVPPEDWPPEVCVAVALEALTEGETECSR